MHSMVHKFWLNGDVNMLYCTYGIEVSRQSFENYSNLMKIRPLRANLFRTERQTSG